MPRAQDFSQATIYNIRHVETRQVIYVGSTCSFATRVRGHKSNCNNPTSNKHHLQVYQFIRENGGWDAYRVVPVSHHNLQNKVELQILEQQEFDRHTNLKNSIHAKRTKAEYDKQYRHINAAAISVDRSTKVRCECGCMCSSRNIAGHRKTAKHLRWIVDPNYETSNLKPLFQ